VWIKRTSIKTEKLFGLSIYRNGIFEMPFGGKREGAASMNRNYKFHNSD